MSTPFLIDGWKLIQRKFSHEQLSKWESIFCQGNGYMGLRCTCEEEYPAQMRNTFIAGTFNKFDDAEITELPNAPDVLAMRIVLDGETLDLSRGQIADFRRSLDMRTGEVERSFLWTGQNGRSYRLHFRRFVSMANLHLLVQRVEVTPVGREAEIFVTSGINGRMTNAGSQHFSMDDLLLTQQNILYMDCHTPQSQVAFRICGLHRASGPAWRDHSGYGYRRRVMQSLSCTAAPGQTAVLEKLSVYHTDRDPDGLMEQAEALLMQESAKTYDELLRESHHAWEAKFHRAAAIDLEADDPFDLAALRFSAYHQAIMVPTHDDRLSIAAKGLSGDGYKGHIFWDTEIFMLPRFTFTQPDIARSLLTYRFRSLDGARRKARERGYAGAMFPWEAAWITDGEVTPLSGGVDHRTGKEVIIWTGLIEIHISSDVAFAVSQYHQMTGDDAFMRDYGCELIFEIANFWASRLEWREDRQRYEITDVIGPDEYKEHADNNAYTNYLAAFSLRFAASWADRARAMRPELAHLIHPEDWLDKAGKLYLPQPNAEGIIPQDDAYLTLPTIDLTEYKRRGTGSIHRDYTMEQIAGMQISKQADLMVLFLLQDTMFPRELKEKNFHYYEPRCMHDSSLSLSTYSILAGDVGDRALSYELFQRACRIDLGENMNSSIDGIHGASLGGIWQCAVLGFGGVRLREGMLCIDPALPEGWRRFGFRLVYRGTPVEVELTHDCITLRKSADDPDVTLRIIGQDKLLHEELVIPC